MQRIGELLKAFLSSRLTHDGERVVELVAAWHEMAGTASAHVRVRDVRSGIVVLEADHPGWGQLMGMRKPSILKVLRERFPEMDLKDIRVVVGSGAPAADRPAAPAESHPQGETGGTRPVQTPPIDEVLDRVPDEGLRRSLRALYDEAGGNSAKKRREN